MDSPVAADSTTSTAPVVVAKDLRQVYKISRGMFQKPAELQAVSGVSFSVQPGKTLAIVGESGCGKSTLSKTLLRLLKPASGRIVLDGTDIAALDERELRPYRGRIQMVFQDPYGSLNPRHTVFDMLDAALRVHGVHGVDSRDERRRRIAAIIDRVGLPAGAVQRYAHEFSGGQRQRIGLARALVLRPRLVICDEPVSSLDVSVRAQILNLLAELKDEFQLATLFISHDLSVVKYMADRVLVMHGGKIVEAGDGQALWARARHPYTQTLIRAVPNPRFDATPLVEPPPSILMWRFAV